MKRTDVYEDLDGNEVSLVGLDREERRLLARLRRHAAGHLDWDAFDNYGYEAVAAFYEARGMRRKEAAGTVLFRILQDLSARLGIAQGMIRPTDYRDQLQELMSSRFPSRRAFCKATGISQDMLSHVLAGRKDLSLPALNRALERIGYELRIGPRLGKKRTG